MIWIIAILLFIISPMLWMLYAPVILHIETEKQVYFIEVSPLVRVFFYKPEYGFGIRILIIPFNWEFQPKLTANKKKAETKREKAKPRYKKKKRTFRVHWSKIRNAIMISWKEFLYSFKVKVFRWELDTDDFVRNAQIYPVFTIVNTNTSQNWNWQINFQGRNNLTLIVQNRLSRLVWIGIKTFFRIF